jgi:capsular polysaccharide biosynthesis protein
MHFWADVIFGPCGTGLSTVLFSKEGVGLLEIQPTNGMKSIIVTNVKFSAISLGVLSQLIVSSDGDQKNSFEANVDEVLVLSEVCWMTAQTIST